MTIALLNNAPNVSDCASILFWRVGTMATWLCLSIQTRRQHSMTDSRLIAIRGTCFPAGFTLEGRLKLIAIVHPLGEANADSPREGCCNRSACKILRLCNGHAVVGRTRGLQPSIGARYPGPHLAYGISAKCTTTGREASWLDIQRVGARIGLEIPFEFVSRMTNQNRANLRCAPLAMHMSTHRTPGKIELRLRPPAESSRSYKQNNSGAALRE